MPLSPKQRRLVIAAHDGVCFYCGTRDATHVDHIVPRACGGTDDLGNLIAACLPCNLRKHRHRLPPDAEEAALAAARAAMSRMYEIATGLPRGTIGSGRREKLDQRVPITMTATMAAQVDAWASRQGISGRSEAIRTIIEDALDA